MLEDQDPCKCGRGHNVIYFCHIESCPNHTKHPEYCILCNNDDGIHDHKPKEIMLQSSMIKDQWLNLKQQANLKSGLVKEWLGNYQQLLNIIDGLAKPPTLTKKAADFIALEREIADFHDDKVSGPGAKSQAKVLTSLRPQYEAFNSRYQALSFLGGIGPVVAWDHYSECVHLVDI